MPLHFISAENIRKPLRGILDSVIAEHISHRLADDFLILCPDEACAQDVRELFLHDPRLHGVLTGESILSLEAWIRKTCESAVPGARRGPEHVLEALFRSILHRSEGFSESNFSVESLYLLISSFRSEMLPARALQNFLEGFDPELAQHCVQWFQEYQARIDESPWLKDFAWQCQEALRQLASGEPPALRGIRRIYYLGFHDFPPLLKMLAQSLAKRHPNISQLLLCQIPQGVEAQDHLSKHWEEALPELYRFHQKDQISKPRLRSYSAPFDEAAGVLRQIIAAVEDGAEPSSIALFLPPQPFWADYYQCQLGYLGLGAFSGEGKKLSSFKTLRDLLARPLPEIFPACQDLAAQRRSELDACLGEAEAPSLAEELRALEQLRELLEEIDFYQAEFPELGPHFPPLLRIAQRTRLRQRRNAHPGIQIRSLSQPGLKEFSHSFIVQACDQNFPLHADRFFNLSLPQHRKQTAQQKALFQHLLGSGQRTCLSYSHLSLQAGEQSPSPFLAPFCEEAASEPSKPFWYLDAENETLKARLQSETLRQQDLLYRNPYGGFLQKPSTLKKLRAWMDDHVFSASRLEDYATCPFSFLARSILGVEAEEEKSIEPNALEQGLWVHRLLELFFRENQAALEKAGAAPPLRAEILESLEREIRRLSQEFLKERDWVRRELFEDFAGRAFSAIGALLEEYWAQWEQPGRKDFFLPRYFEAEFGFREGGLEFRRPGQPTLRLRGKIDRIDLSQDGRKMIVYDYKTGDTVDLSSKIREFKKLQLPFYLLAAQKMEGLENREAIGAFAWGLKEMSRNQGLLRQEYAKEQGIRANSKCVMKEEEWEGFWQAFEEKILDYHQAMFQGDFRTQPDPCNPYCDYQSVCRYHDKKKP